MFLMMQWAFEAGYRRYEWKCNALNQASRRAAQRLGFSFEGIFRQMMIVKGRNRDTAWFAAIDREWPALKTAFERYLDEKNFDEKGRPVTVFTALLLHKKVSTEDYERLPFLVRIQVGIFYCEAPHRLRRLLLLIPQA